MKREKLRAWYCKMLEKSKLEGTTLRPNPNPIPNPNPKPSPSPSPRLNPKQVRAGSRGGS